MSKGNIGPEKCLIAFATAWGSEFGGINVFNTELLQHLAFACHGRVSVVCVVPTADPNTVQLAGERGVQLVRLPQPPMDSRFDASLAEAAIEALRSRNVLSGASDIVWLGHDRVTGEIALRARNLAGVGRTALIHHMSYLHYEAFAENALVANSKSLTQKHLFQQAEILFAVGPLLRDALRDMVRGRDVTSLIPGLDEVAALPAPNTFTAFMSGRLTADAAKIKQGHLGIAAFADANKRACEDTRLANSLRNEPRLILRGAYLESQGKLGLEPDYSEWIRFAENYAGRVVNIFALPYTTERKTLLEELASSTVALMPSWHEGFGLVGWEAIAAGVPLVVSKKSGLYKFLEEESHGAWISWVYAVDVLGTVDSPFFREEDLNAVSERLLEIAKDVGVARDKASRLREALLSKFTWKHCVDNVLENLQWSSEFVVATLSRDLQAEATRPEPSVSSLESTAPENFPLVVPQPMWELGSGLADSQLLRAEEEAVPFDSAREPDMLNLLDWAQNPEFAHALRLVTGAGGTGKTRLAIEFCSRLGQNGWQCGFLRSEIKATQMAHAWSALEVSTQPVLVVFDYAETRQDVLLAFLRAMLQAPLKPRLRLLLIARDAGEWWDRLPTRDPLCDPFLSGYATSGPFALPSLHNQLPQREAAFQSAVTAYSGHLGIGAMPQIRLDLTGDHFDRPLYIQMAALLALHGERPASAEGLTKALLNHERRYWRRVLSDLSTGSAPPPTDDRYAAELMVLATLAGGFGRFKDIRDLWITWSDSAASELEPIQQRGLFERLSRLYPGDQGLQPLRPDLLGEALVAHELLQPSGMTLLDALLGSRSTTSQRRNALTVLARLSNHRLDLAETVIRSLTRSFLSCAVDLINVAAQIDSRLPEWAESAFARLTVPNRNQSAGLLMPRMQYESVQLSRLMCAISESIVEQARRKMHSKGAGIESKAKYAESLRVHAISLGRTGRPSSRVAKEAVEIYEQLALKQPRVFEPELASALTTYSKAQHRDGNIADALDASYRSLKLYDRLAANKPREHEPELASVLDEHAIYLAKEGKYAEALPTAYRAVQIYEKLADKDPDRHEGNWSAALHNYSGHLWENERYDEYMEFAKKALELRERLVVKNPDRFEPKLASTLLGYSSLISFRGEYFEALECARRAELILAKLAVKNAQRFESEWADSISACAGYLADIGEYTDAFDRGRQSLEITERLLRRESLRFIEDYYVRSLGVYWFAWLAARPMLNRDETPPELDLSRLPAHRVRILKIYQAWVDACYAENYSQRFGSFWIVVSEGNASDGPAFKHIEEYWLCAAAWCSAHAIESVSGQNHLALMPSRYQGFLTQRQGTLPSWMREVATRMHFRWSE